MKKRIIVSIGIYSIFLLNGCIDATIENILYNNNLAGADYWSEEPKILSAGLGFCDIIAADFDEINEENVRAMNGAWLSDLNCDDEGNTRLRSFASIESQVSSAYRGEVDYSTLKDGAIAFDALPIVFSWPVLTDNVEPTDFQFTLNTGEIVTPLFAGMFPNWEYNERNCVVVFGEFANRLKSTNPNARFPVKCEIVDDGTPLHLVGEDGNVVNAVGLSWETTTTPYDDNQGPRLVGAKLNYCGERPIGEGLAGSILERSVYPNDEFALYGGGDFRLRMLTSGGFSPDGVRGILPTDYERYFRVHVQGENNTVVTLDKVGETYNVLGGTLKVIGLSDLGQAQENYDDCYVEDSDNYIDIILEGDEEAARNITFLEIPSLSGGYGELYSPGGPGTTPFPNVIYTEPGPSDLEPVIIALDDPMRVNYDAKRHQ